MSSSETSPSVAPGWGWRRAAKAARRAGWVVNDKGVRRLWRDQGLRVPQTKRKKPLRGIGAQVAAMSPIRPHERADTRSNQRNGARTRMLSTPAGDIELRIPKVRVGSFFPSLLEPRRHVDKALWAVIMTAYITGISARKVDDLVKAVGCDTGVSKSTVSRICGEIDEQVGVFRTRGLGHLGFPYVFVDGHPQVAAKFR